MKVVCAGCQAKYQIPDERVAGRKLKIRCRRCGDAIIVRGDQATTQPAAQVQPMHAAEEWHVSLEGDQHGPYPSGHMATMLRNGQLAWDAYVWRDGYADWKTAGDSDTLVRAVAAVVETASDDDPTSARPAPQEALQPLARSAFAARSAQRSSPQLAAASPYRASRAAYDYSNDAAYSNGYAEGAQSESAGDEEAGYAQAGYAQGGYDQGGQDQGGYEQGGQDQGGYAQAQYAQGGYEQGGYEQGGYEQGGYEQGGYEQGGEDQGGYDQANPRVSASRALTGERHEDSVLFSARNLQLAASSSASQPRAGHAGGEGSGLIDIRALASLARSTPSSSSAHGSNGHSNGRGREEVLSALAHQTGAFGRIDSLAPVDRPSRTRSSNAVPLAIVTGSAMVAAAAFLGVYLTRDRGTPAAAPVAVSSEQAVAAEPPAAAPTDQPAEPAPAEAAAEPEAAPAPAAEPETEAAAAEPSKSSASSRSSSRSRASSKRSERTLHASKAEPKAKPEREAAASAKKEAASAKKEAASAKKDKEKGDSPSIDDLLLADAKPEPKPAPEPAAASAAPAAKTAQSSRSRSIDELLDGAVDKTGKGGKPQGAAAAASSAALPDAPSREQVQSAMKGVAGDVKACAEGQALEAPTATVAVTVAGATGHVSGVRVTGIQGTVGSCVARAVRGANFPKFAKESLTINYPFRLK